MTKPPPTLDELTQALIDRDARDWRQFHSLKYLKVSLGLEATEALELTKWKSDEDVEAALNEADFRARMAEECADVPCSGRSSTPGTLSAEIIDKQLDWSITLQP